jgi:hypothetical protein
MLVRVHQILLQVPQLLMQAAVAVQVVVAQMAQVVQVAVAQEVTVQEQQELQTLVVAAVAPVRHWAGQADQVLLLFPTLHLRNVGQAAQFHRMVQVSR